MNKEQLIEYFGDIDEHYVKEAAPGNRPAKKLWWGLAGVAAAVVLVAAVTANIPALWDAPEPGPAVVESSGFDEILGQDEVGDAPAHIRWHGHAYVHHGQAVYEMPKGLELLGEVNRVVEEGGIVPEDTGDLSANIDGNAYWFTGNDSLIVFRYTDWDTSYAAVELGRKEPILLMFREFDEEEPHQAGQPYYTLSDLVQDSDVIVEGTDAQLNGVDLIGGGNVLYTFQVADVLRGRVATETIRVRVPEDSGVLEASSEGRYLLFLRREMDGNFRPVFASQGVYPIERKFLHVPANDPCRMTTFPTLHTSDSHFWYLMNNVREWIRELQSTEPVT